MTIIDNQFYIIDSLSKDVSLELNAKLVVAWLYLPTNSFFISGHAQIQKVLSEGMLWQRSFFNWWGERGSKYHYERAIIGPPAKRL